MNCRDVEPLISAFLENELPPAVRGQVERHLRECASCSLQKEGVELLLCRLPELQDDVPFLLKNRLLNISEPRREAVRTGGRLLWMSKWAAVAVGTLILVFNLFYFTNVFPAANRRLHTIVAGIERFAVRTGGWVEKISESKDLLLYALLSPGSSATSGSGGAPPAGVDKLPGQGGSNG